MMGLMPTSSKRAYATHCDRVLLDHLHTQTHKGRFCSVSVGSLAPDFRKILFEPSEHLLRVCSLDSKRFCPPTILLRLLLSLEHGVYFLVGFNILLLMVIQQRVVILEFS